MTFFASTGPHDGDLRIRGDQGYIGIKAGTAAAVPVGWAIINETYQTNNHSITAVLGDQGDWNGVATYLYTHSNTSHTEGAFCSVRLGQIQMGIYTRTGSVYGYSPFSGGTNFLENPSMPGSGSSIEFRNVGTTWSVLYNSELLFNLVNSSVTFDPAHRTPAISMERMVSPDPVLPYPAGATFESYRIAGLVVNDIVTPTYQGSGAKMIAEDSDTDSGSSGDNLFPTNFFTTLESASGDITGDVETAKFTVSIDGWYTVDLRHASAIPNGEGVDDNFAHLLYKNGTLFKLGSQRLPTYNGTHVVWATGLQSTWAGVPLRAGDYVQAAYRSTSSLTDMFASEVTGTENYFSIALTTRNLL